MRDRLLTVDHARTVEVGPSADAVEADALTPRRAQVADLVADAPGRWPDLTKREKQIARRVAEGQTNDEIANELCLALNTVKTYMQSLLPKLGARNRVEVTLAYLAAVGRLLPAPDPPPPVPYPRRAYAPARASW